jgi:subtilisin family serine protease
MANSEEPAHANEDEVAAVVSPRSRIEPLFERTTTITSQTVDRYYSDPDSNRDAVRELRALGFTIAAVGPVTISISGPQRLFEEVFGASLRRRTTTYFADRERGGAGRGELEATGGAVVKVEAAYFEVADKPTQVLQAPQSLQYLIEGVALARPPELFESPLPPLAPPGPYRYLTVPSEVGGVLRATRVHRIGHTGLGVRVGMIDTGHYMHPFFTLHGYRRDSVLLGPAATDPLNDLYGHGTGESANIFATAPGARLRPIKGLIDPVGDINLAVASTPRPQILSNSWGYDVDYPGSSLTDPYLIALEASVANAVAQGIIVCFSAGNGHFGFPASHPEVLAVGGVHVNYQPCQPALDLEASSYASSFDSTFYPGRHVPDFCGLVGRSVAFEAPLIMLPVQQNSALDLPNSGASDDGWGIFSGTSAACPQVAGVVALLLGYDPTLTRLDVRQILRDSARDVTTGYSAMGDAASPGPDAATGAGLVDAREAWATMTGL